VEVRLRIDHLREHRICVPQEAARFRIDKKPLPSPDLAAKRSARVG